MTTRPPTNNEHGQAFAIIFAIQMAIVIPWIAWVWQSQMAAVANPVPEMRYPQ